VSILIFLLFINAYAEYNIDDFEPDYNSESNKVETIVIICPYQFIDYSKVNVYDPSEPFTFTDLSADCLDTRGSWVQIGDYEWSFIWNYSIKF